MISFLSLGMVVHEIGRAPACADTSTEYIIPSILHRVHRVFHSFHRKTLEKMIFFREKRAEYANKH
jgi:hypothetical protein